MNNSEILFRSKHISKLYIEYMAPICSSYNLTQMEVNVIAFLHNNPKYDTASDIVNYRMLSKSNVSTAVENLIKKKILCKKADETDRRKAHLILNQCDEITASIVAMQLKFVKTVLSGFTQEDKRIFFRYLEQIDNNIISNIDNLGE
ncbi:MAG: helix-turn-helix domain-containing protein [Clostridia bacterium]